MRMVLLHGLRIDSSKYPQELLRQPCCEFVSVVRCIVTLQQSDHARCVRRTAILYMHDIYFVVAGCPRQMACRNYVDDRTYVYLMDNEVSFNAESGRTALRAPAGTCVYMRPPGGACKPFSYRTPFSIL